MAYASLLSRTAIEAFNKEFEQSGDKVSQPIRSRKVEPKGDYQSFIASVGAVERHRAKYSVNYPNGKPLLTFQGEFFYFNSKNKAIQIRDQLKKQFDIETVVYYGPMATKGRSGQVVEIKSL